MWIETIDPEQATGQLDQLYTQVKGPSGHVDNILRAHSLRPRTLKGHLQLYKAALHSRPNGLSPKERELVGVWVSQLNQCDYCTLHHTAGLARHLGDEALAKALGEAALDAEQAKALSPREAALLDYTRALTKEPGCMTRAALAPLREVGLDDAAILDLNQIVAYFAYANRTVLGLGVSPDGEPLGLHPDEDREDFQHG